MSFSERATDFAFSSDVNGRKLVDLYTLGLQDLVKSFPYEVPPVKGGESPNVAWVNWDVVHSKTPVELYLRLMTIIYHLWTQKGVENQNTYRIELINVRKALAKNRAMYSTIWQGKHAMIAEIDTYLAGLIADAAPIHSYITGEDADTPLNRAERRKMAPYVRSAVFGDDQTASESITTACHPLVPYVGTHQFQIENIFPPDWDYVNSGMTEHDAEIVRLCQKMNELMACPSSCMEIIKCIDEVVEVYEKFDEFPSAWVHSGQFCNVTIPVAQMMTCLYAYRYCTDTTMHGGARACIRDLCSANATLKAIVDEDPRPSVVRALEADLTGYTNHILEAANSVMTGILHYEGVTSKVEKAESAVFDLGMLRNFINATRRYTTNRYTNQAFAGNCRLASISYVDDFILIQPQTKKGCDDVCYIPLVDLLGGRRVVVARIVRGSNDIDIITEQEFHKMMEQYNVDDEPDVEVDEDIPDDLTEAIEAYYDNLDELDLAMEGANLSAMKEWVQCRGEISHEKKLMKSAVRAGKWAEAAEHAKTISAKLSEASQAIASLPQSKISMALVDIVIILISWAVSALVLPKIQAAALSHLQKPYDEKAREINAARVKELQIIDDDYARFKGSIRSQQDALKSEDAVFKELQETRKAAVKRGIEPHDEDAWNQVTTDLRDTRKELRHKMDGLTTTLWNASRYSGQLRDSANARFDKQHTEMVAEFKHIEALIYQVTKAAGISVPAVTAIISSLPLLKQLLTGKGNVNDVNKLISAIRTDIGRLQKKYQEYAAEYQRLAKEGGRIPGIC